RSRRGGRDGGTICGAADAPELSRPRRRHRDSEWPSSGSPHRDQTDGRHAFAARLDQAASGAGFRLSHSQASIRETIKAPRGRRDASTSSLRGVRRLPVQQPWNAVREVRTAEKPKGDLKLWEAQKTA